VQTPQLLDLEAAASRLAVAPRTLREWAAAGRVPYYRLGRALRFSEADLVAFVARSRVGAD
jgi:excisionase family DNA binding protein